MILLTSMPTRPQLQGNTEQATNRGVPLRSGDREGGLWPADSGCGDFVYLAAQNEHDSGRVIRIIKADGVEIERATSSGGYVIATCSELVP
jgi:hypothetical protein